MDGINKQELARYRNCNKFMISGLPKPIMKKYMTIEECEKWDIILYNWRSLMDNWQENSIKLGLNAKQKYKYETYE